MRLGPLKPGCLSHSLDPWRIHVRERIILTALPALLLLFAACEASAPRGDTDAGPGASGTDSGSPMPGSDAGPGAVGTDAGPGAVGTDAEPGAVGTDAGTPDVLPVDAGSGGGSGACTNPADDAVFSSNDVDAVVGDCAGDCFGGGGCTADCVVDAIGLSEACADCYGDASQCTVDNCALQCLGGGDSAPCRMCRDSMGCTAAFNSCSGR